MLENLVESLKDQIGGEILNKTDVQSDQLPGIFSVIGDTAKTEVKNSMLDGGLNTVMNLFSNKPNNAGANLLQSSITQGIVSGLVQKIGLKKSTATAIAGVAVPVLMNMITKKNNETPEDDPSPINALFGGNETMGNLGGNLLNNLLNP
jgi:uncharacterized protein YidB (DUF937 family)